MITEKTITICGKEVKLRYCAATETNYEFLAEKPINVFFPQATGKMDENGNPILEEAKATQEDNIMLGFGAILAAYEMNEEEPPVTVKDIRLKAEHEEVENLKAAVIELLMEWYKIPKTVPKSEFVEEGEAEKSPNALAPANGSSDS